MRYVRECLIAPSSLLRDVLVEVRRAESRRKGVVAFDVKSLFVLEVNRHLTRSVLRLVWIF